MCKRIILIMLVVFAVMRAEAQQLNYQAIARNANGVALTFRDVGIRLSIRDGSPNGSIVFSESRNIRTNQFGLFTVVIGSSGATNVLGSMASINWISGNKYLQVEIDPEGGTNYFQAGTSQLQAVPYALFANAAYPVGPAGGDLLGSTYPNPIIAPLAVTTGKIANQAITTPKIADLNVTTPKLADQAVTNAKIQDNTIANIKLVNSRVTLNGLILNLGDTQDFAIGTNGIDVNIVSAGNTHTFNFPDASIANRGLITPNAQTIGGNKTFNNDITAARIIRAGGLAAQFLKADGSIDNNIYLTENQPITVTATGDAIGVSTSSRTAPVLPLTLATVNSAVGTYGTNIVVPSITVNNKGLVTNVVANPIPTATAITSGLLTVGDWNIFNNKQNAIPLGAATQYFRGDLTLSNFQTDVRNQLSAGTNITYANGNIGLTNNSVTLNTLPLALGGSQTFATGTTGVDFNISSTGSVHTFNIPNASVFARGLISSTDYTNFNAAYNNRIASLTTTGTSGEATLSGNVLNIPNYTIAGLGGENTIVPGTTLQYWRGDKTWQTLNSSIVPEGTNFYYTDTRSRNALSITTSGSNGAATYNSALGVFNIPAYTLNGLGGVPSSRLINGLDLSADRTFSTSDIAEGSRQYFTASRARTSISLTTVGTGGLSTYDNTTGVLNIPNYTVTGLGAEPSITAGNALQYWRGDKTWQTLNTTVVPEGTNEYFTQAKARSSISLTTTGTSGSAVYSPATGVLNVPSYTLGGLGGETAITPGSILEYWRGDKSWQTLNTTVVPEGTNQYFTQAKARTSISLTTTGTNGAAAYDNTTGVLNVPAYTLAGLGGVPTSRQINGVDLSTDRTFTTTEINEGTNLYFNNTRARSAISLTTTGNSGLAAYNSGTGILNIPEYTIGGLGGVSTARTINGIDLSANQSFTVGTAGTTFNISNAGTVHSFNIPNSSTALVTGGLLSNTDWTTFNNKQNTISGTGYGKWAGSTISFIPQIPLGTDVTGTLLAGNFGALTGDVTNTAGSYATTISNDAITTAKILNGSVTNDKIADGTVSNAKLVNSSFTLGSTSIALGSTTTTVAGLTLTSPTINSPAINYTNTSPITAGANTQGSLNITTDHNIILTAAASSAVTLPVGIEGRRITIVNRGANPVNVYPAAGGQINTLGTNAVFSNIPANTYAEFYATSTTQWYSANSASASTTQWNVLGNTGLSAATNFVGTTDAIALRFRVNNTFSGQIHPDATVGNTSFGLETNSTTNNNSYNSAFGSYALRANTNSGVRNSAFGALALASNNSGLDNTSVGQGSLTSNLSGDNNTGIGQGALAFNSTGSSNTAVGQAALNTSSTTSNNTAVGRSALFASTGSNNTGIGHFALLANTTGSANTAVGQNSLSANTTTSNNTALGWEALRNTTNSGNVGIGYNAGVNATFSNSISIGLNANVGSDNGIAIGAPATVGATSGNSIAIGLSASTTAQQSIAIGSSSVGGGTAAIAIGQTASATGLNAVAIGNGASNAVNNSITLGGATNTIVRTTGSMNAGKFIGNTSGTSLTHVSGILDQVTPPFLSGNDVAGFITFTTGPVPVGTGNFITVTFGSSYSGGNPVVIIQPVSNTAPRGLATSIYCLPSSTLTGSFIISTGATLLANTEYQIAYHVIGRQ